MGLIFEILHPIQDGVQETSFPTWRKNGDVLERIGVLTDTLPATRRVRRFLQNEETVELSGRRAVLVSVKSNPQSVDLAHPLSYDSLHFPSSGYIRIPAQSPAFIRGLGVVIGIQSNHGKPLASFEAIMKPYALRRGGANTPQKNR